MARLQILELPTEHHGDDMTTPFVLVIDQLPADDDGAAAIRRDLGSGDTPTLIGARAVLAFEETIDIPANDYAPDAASRDVSDAEFTTMATAVRRALGIDITEGEPDIAGWLLAACRELEKSEDARKRVAKECRAALADALGVDRLRDWDNIRNAARGLRKERDAQAAALERVRNLPEEPELMDGRQPEPNGYRRGYEVAIRDAKRASRAVSVQTPQGPRPGKVVGGQGTADA